MIEVVLHTINPHQNMAPTETAVEVPENWREVIAAGKFDAVMRVLMAQPDRVAASWELFLALGNVKPAAIAEGMGAATSAQRGKLQVDDFTAAHVMEMLREPLSFVFDAPFEQNPHPELTINGKKLRGPQARLMDQTGHQWMLSHHCQVTNPDDLLTLMAINYTLEGGFNENKIADVRALLVTQPEEIVKGFALWYRYCEEWHQRHFAWMYNTDDDDEAPRSNKPATGNELIHLMQKLSGNSIGPVYDNILKKTRQLIMVHLDFLEDERLKTEAAMSR